MPEVNENNTHWMFGRVDTAFGGTVVQMAPHLFGPDANEPPPFEHLAHAVEFEQDAMRVAAQHVTSDDALSVAEQTRIDNALQEAADSAAAAAADDGEVDAAELEAVVAQLVAAGAAASDARVAADKAAAKAAKKSAKAPKG